MTTIVFDGKTLAVDSQQTQGSTICGLKNKIQDVGKYWFAGCGTTDGIEEAICEFIGVGLDEDACWALKQQSGSIYIADKSWCQPIETPEERAKREREEWCSKALDSAGILSEMKRYELKRLGEYIGSIHDALQSGELPMPNKESE